MLKKFKNQRALHKLSKIRGFSAIEILFGIAIFTLVVGALTLFSRNVWVYGTFISTGLGEANDGRNTLKNMIAEIRTATTADTGAYVIALATPTAFTFYSDIDDDNLKERVRYFLNGTDLQKGVLKPSGSPLSYTGAETVTTVISKITNANIFSYYDENYDGTSAPLASPITLALIRLIKIDITIDKDPNRAPTATSLSTQVSLRNLKDNL